MPAEAQAAQPTGILPFQTLRALVRDGEIASEAEIAAEQIQPASIDLRLGARAWRIPASFLPGEDATVLTRIGQLGGHELDLTKGAVLEKGCVYLVPLQERLALSPGHSAFANPKSSTGRLDVFTRVITDRATEFDRVERGYEGPLYAEIAPRTFSILVRPGSRLSQLRVRRGTPGVSGGALKRLQEQMRLVDADAATMREDSIGVTIDLRGDRADRLVGFRAKKHTDVIDVDLRAHYDALDFWEPIHHRPGRPVVLNPDDFYILATREAVAVPPDHAAEMVAYDTLVGEFRVHYAGFFDPGFGFGQGQGSRAVLEVRSHEVPFVLEHGQLVGWLRYERLTATPDKIYGPSIGSHYQRQGLQLGKHFKAPEP